MDYPISEFNDYCNIVLSEMFRRGYKVSDSSVNKLKGYTGFYIGNTKEYLYPYQNWHNLRYLEQCYYNLQEKYDCGGIPVNEWELLDNKYKRYKSGYGWEV